MAERTQRERTLAAAAQLAGLVAIGVGLYQAWPPLAWVYAGLMAILVARLGSDDEAAAAPGADSSAGKDSAI